MSTNDTVLLQASGAAGAPPPEGLLDAVLLQLALDIVADGEGATRVARVEVAEARDAEEAERVARTIANSPLVKTALFGRDPNWGGSPRRPGWRWRARSSTSSVPAAIDAAELGGEETEARDRGPARPRSGLSPVYFSDLTHDYVRINAEYTT